PQVLIVVLAGTALQHRLLTQIGRIAPFGPPALAHLVARRIERHGIEPGTEPARALEAADGACQAYAHLLRHVLGILPVAAPSPGDGMDEIIAAFDQRGECLPVSQSRLLDEFCFHGSIPIACTNPYDVRRMAILGWRVRFFSPGQFFYDGDDRAHDRAAIVAADFRGIEAGNAAIEKECIPALQSVAEERREIMEAHRNGGYGESDAPVRQDADTVADLQAGGIRQET